MGHLRAIISLTSLLSTLAFTPVVVYVSFLSPLSSSPPNSTDITRLKSSDADDTPLVSVDLPQVFPYFGQYVDKLYVSPNGYVQMSPVNNCGCCYCSSCQNGFASYEGVIGGFLTDLNPSQNGTVSLYEELDGITIVYDDIALYGDSDLDYLWSFRTSFYSDGKIVISYDNITRLEDLPSDSYKPCTWATGLFSPRNNDTAVFTDDQLATGRDVWFSSNNGVFPSTRNVSTGLQFTACPMSTSWCGTPSTIDLSAVPALFNATTLSTSCTDTLELALYISNISSLTTDGNGEFIVSSGEIGVMPCHSDDSLSPYTLMCDFSSVSSQLFEGSWYVYPAWRELSISGNGNYTLLGETLPIPVTVQSSGASTTCSLNSAVGSCAACEICNGANISDCMMLVCDSDSASSSTDVPFPSNVEPYDALYVSPSCNTSCIHVFDYAEDKNGICCPIDTMDCMGKCGGSSEEGTNSDSGNLVCCSENNPPDCNGVCGGKASYDTCNVCGGTDNGKECPTHVEITTGQRDPTKLHTYYPAFESYDTISYITVANSGNTSISVRFRLASSDQSLDPFITLPTAAYNLSAGTNMTFNVTSSLQRLWDGVVSSWDVKTISVQYIRPSQFQDYISFNMDVLPLQTDCGMVTRRLTCMGLPGCIHCLNFKQDMRVLRLEDGSDNDIYANQIGLEKRQLYANILPELAGIFDDESTGVCEDGWRNSDCSTFPSDSAGRILGSPFAAFYHLILPVLLIAYLSCCGDVA